jgi:hypothetical protein
MNKNQCCKVGTLFHGAGYIPLRLVLDLTLSNVNKTEKDRGNGKEGAVRDNAFDTGKLTKKMYSCFPAMGARLSGESRLDKVKV